ncbi:MAG: SufD family Fe-S cluster assembly protein [Puniceicoccales bacterium]|jgi:hypothetical protein|nr:SufD family Fe-S cluster assembly protein [Puniceicoccales bacterium]
MRVIRNHIATLMAGRRDFFSCFRKNKISEGGNARLCSSERVFVRPNEDIYSAITVGENLSLDVVILAIGCKNCKIFLKFKLEAFSRLKCLVLVERSEVADINMVIELNGDHSRSEIKNFFVGENFNRQIFSLSQVHNAKHSLSTAASKVILDDFSTAEFYGDISIAEIATGCDARQRSDSILLSSEAKATSCPNLNILNNAVKCSHGATVGTIDRRAIFYMMSRGLNEQTCKRLIVDGELAAMISA